MHPLDRLRETRLLPVIIGLTLVALALFLLRVADILPPFIWAAVTAYVLHPLVSRLERRLRMPRALAIAVVYVVLIGLLVVLALQVAPAVVVQIGQLVHALPKLIDNARQALLAENRIAIGGFSIDTRQITTSIETAAKDLAAGWGRQAPSLVLQTFGFLVNLLVYLLATYYFLLQGDGMVGRLRELAPPRHHETVQRITDQVNDTFGAYVRAQLLLFAIISAVVFVALSILNLPYAGAIAIASGLLELIPVIGPWTAAGIAMTVALSQPSGPFGWSPTGLAVAVGLVYLGIRMVEDQIVIPQLIGRIVRLHPLLVIFGVLAGAQIAGALGLLLAVPVLAAAKIIGLAVLEEVRNPPARRVVPVRQRGALQAFAARIGDYDREQVVLLIAQGAVGWDDLETAQQLAGESLLRSIRLQAVTPDRVAASIVTAAGIEVVTRVGMEDEAGVLADREPAIELVPAASPPSPVAPPGGGLPAPSVRGVPEGVVE
ncbi:MAG TPA: AI-2E family transporter [Thermomicrobiaceae bacterium]|nr:AI-2E family transporter [Thermomicrobiaceae bacterium]